MRALTRPWAIRIAAGSMMTALVLSACSSTSNKSSTAAGGGNPSSSAGGGSTSSTAAGAGSGSSNASGSAVTIEAKMGPLGDYLTDAAGRTLYVFAADRGTTSTCTGSCASFWPPLTTTGAPAAGSGAQASLLGTSARSDGTTQITYAGHPLYRFKLDAHPGDANGQGKNIDGGLWWVVDPSGKAITGSSSPSSSSGGSGGGSAGGWS